jgi:uncharacterized protein YbjT (DUF2867 family)
VVGRHVVTAAQRAGHEAVVLSRRTGFDLRTGEGLADALAGVQVVVDATNGPIGGKRATAFFTEVTGRLQTAAASAGVSHLLTLSIVGLERVSRYGYYRAKLAQEEAARSGPVPVTIVRSTQFHEFPAQILARARMGPVAMVPMLRIQPIAARTVGEIVAQTAAGPPPSHPVTVEIAGPEPVELVVMARALIERRGVRVRILGVPIPGAAGRAVRAGGLLPSAGTRLAGPTFSDWLAGDDSAAPPF